jgi:hypothetical protein
VQLAWANKEQLARPVFQARPVQRVMRAQPAWANKEQQDPWDPWAPQARQDPLVVTPGPLGHKVHRVTPMDPRAQPARKAP